MRHETALVTEKENHAVTRGKQEGNRGKQTPYLMLHTLMMKKISHSDAVGKKQTAPSAHRSGWGEPDQELSLWQAGLYAVHSGGDAS